MPDEGRKQTIDETFDADRERDQIRKIGEGMNRLAAHWAYLGDFRGGRSSREFWTAKHRLQRLCGVQEAGDEPDFAESMQDRSLQSLEKSVDATLGAMKAYEERHSTFFGFLARLFNLVSYARMQDTEIAIRRLQEMKNSIVRLRTHGEELNVPSADNTEKENQIADEEKTAEKSAEKTAEKTAQKTAEKAAKKTAEKTAEKTTEKTVEKPAEKTEEKPAKKTAEKVSEEQPEPPEVSYEPAYDEKRELAFRNMEASERSPLKTQQGQEEFFQGYEEFTVKHPDQLDAFNSNDIQVLKKLSQDLGKDVPGLDAYLERRMKNLQKIDQLEKKSEQNFKQRQTHEPLIEKKNGETTTVILPDVTQPQLQHTLCGCWSVALSTMLRQKGVEIDQETIRAFRPDKKICSANDLQAVNGDRCNAIDLSRELIMKVVPDTALNSVQTEVSHYNLDASFKPWDPQQKMEKRNEFKEKMRAVLKRSLETDKGSLAILMKDHYQTVYGYEKVEKDGKEEEYVYIHDPNDPNKTRVTLDELAESGYKVEKDRENTESKGSIISETYSFDAQWLQDLTNAKGELTLDAGLEGKGVTYKDHELKCDKLMPYANQADANANWKALNSQMGQDISMKTYLPATVKNLAKNRVLDPVKPSELTHREKKLTGSEPRKHTMQKEASGLSEVKKPEDLRKRPPVK